MNPDAPFAILVTWTCYGTWLPGDERGHVSNLLDQEGDYEAKQNAYGASIAAGDDRLHNRARALQKDATVWLSASQANCAAQRWSRPPARAAGESCAEP